MMLCHLYFEHSQLVSAAFVYPVCESWYSPNSILLTYTETSPRAMSWTSWKSQTQTDSNHEIMKFRWKSLTQITKVAVTDHFDMSRSLRQSLWQVCDKLVCVVCVALWNLVHYYARGKSATTSADFFMDTSHESPRHKSWKSATWFVSWTFMICVCDFPHREVSVKIAKSS